MGVFRRSGLLVLSGFAVILGLVLELCRVVNVVGRTGQARLARHLLTLLGSPFGVLGGLLYQLIIVLIVWRWFVSALVPPGTSNWTGIRRSRRCNSEPSAALCASAGMEAEVVIATRSTRSR